MVSSYIDTDSLRDPDAARLVRAVQAGKARRQKRTPTRANNTTAQLRAVAEQLVAQVNQDAGSGQSLNEDERYACYNRSLTSRKVTTSRRLPRLDARVRHVQMLHCCCKD